MRRVEKLIFEMRHRVALPPAADAPAGTRAGGDAARQVDAVLMSAGFKCSGELLAALGGRAPEAVIDLGTEIIGWARELVGDHVRHNTYFIDFPANVPGTIEFWAQCVRDALAKPGGRADVLSLPGGDGGVINLLTLPGYGRYQHAYEEMVARHEELIPALSDRITVLHLGGTAEEEASRLYEELAGSTVPLSGEALQALRFLAAYHGGAVVTELLIRENKAVVNAARVRIGLAPEVDTLTDVLRVAAELSGGDVTLATPTRFRSFPRAQRRVVLAALDAIASAAPGSLPDVRRHAEQWKRLGERLHPHEWPGRGAADVFAVARGDKKALSLAQRADLALARDVSQGARLLATAPGMLWRAADYLLRVAQATAAGGSSADPGEVLACFAATAPQVSGRVLLSVREHLQNRVSGKPGGSRVFVNRHGRAWVTRDRRDPLQAHLVARMLDLIDAEVSGRLPDPGRLVIDPAIETVALPLSGKAAPAGLHIYPRGSVTPVEGDLLRFFVYWKQRRERTDFDLSALFTGEQLDGEVWLSYTNLRAFGGEHSGDITEAPAGASEFVNVHLDKMGRRCVIPQVYVFSGEGFDEVEENFFGFMTLSEGQQGAPFEPRTVRVRSALSGDGRAAMPLVFYRGEDGRWYAKWLHLYLRGREALWGGVRVEENRVTSRLLTQTVLERDYLRVGYLIDLLRRKAEARASTRAEDEASTEAGEGPVTYVGLEQPADLPANSTVYTLANLASLIPA